MKKIILVSFLYLDELPPMMTVLKVLSKNHKILYIGVDDLTDTYKNLFGNNIKFINISNGEMSNGNGILSKCKRYIQTKSRDFKWKRVNKIIEKNYCSGDLLWIHHEFTLMHLRRLTIPYFLTMYELHQDLFKKKSELKYRVKKAKKVIVPEYTRSAIVKACAGLNDMPVVIQNKPYDYNLVKTRLENNPMKDIVEKAHAEKKKVILYSGIFLRERKLDTFIEAVRNLNDKFEVVLMGRKSQYLDELLENYPFVKYIGFFNPPSHLSVVEMADIGILTYVADSGSINPVFCAPNKIWEYAKYGIPMLCNDIPGLKYTVEYNKFGLCCNENSIDSICNALKRICDNYQKFSENAFNYYKTVDIEKDILQVIENE